MRCTGCRLVKAPLCCNMGAFVLLSLVSSLADARMLFVAKICGIKAAHQNSPTSFACNIRYWHRYFASQTLTRTSTATTTTTTNSITACNTGKFDACVELDVNSADSSKLWLIRRDTKHDSQMEHRHSRQLINVESWQQWFVLLFQRATITMAPCGPA